jgi:hypothetical protein
LVFPSFLLNPDVTYRPVKNTSGRRHTATRPLTSKGADVQLSLRPYATAGIALTGAGLIAIAPITTPPPLKI